MLPKREGGFSGLIFKRMTDIEDRFAGNCDDLRISEGIMALSRWHPQAELTGRFLLPSGPCRERHDIRRLIQR